MPSAHLYDLWTNTCGLVCVARAFGLVGHACATKCEKCEKEGKAYALRWKSSRMWARFLTAQNAKIWWFLKMTTRFICFARRYCSHSLVHLRSVFSVFIVTTSKWQSCDGSEEERARSLARKPASAVTVLRTINLRKCTQLFVNRMF